MSKPALRLDGIASGLLLTFLRLDHRLLGQIDLLRKHRKRAPNERCPRRHDINPTEKLTCILGPGGHRSIMLLEVACVGDKLIRAFATDESSIAHQKAGLRHPSFRDATCHFLSVLHLTAEEMRQAGYRTVDMLVRHLTDETAPPIRRASATEMRELIGRSAPEHATPFAEVLDDLERDVLPYRARGDHPGFFAFIAYCGTWPGALGDFVASTANADASMWMVAAGPSQVELEVLG